MAGEIDPYDDEDYFRLEVERRATVVVTAAGNAQFGALTDADGGVLSTMEWIPERSEFQLQGELDVGSYYVGLASEETGRYEIVARETEPDDHGNRPDTATVVLLGGTVNGVVERRDDIDYFRLDLPRPVTVAVSVASEFDNAELNLLDAEAVWLQEGYGTARTDLRTRAELAPGTYYSSVVSFRSVTAFSAGLCGPPQRADYIGPYRLSVQEVAPDDHGGLPATATNMQLDTTARGVIGYITGEIDPREDQDVYRLELARRTDLIVDVVGTFPPRARILNAVGAEIAMEDGGILEEIILTQACDDWTMKPIEPNSEERQLQIRYAAQPGVYYVELSSLKAAGRYEVVVRGSGQDRR